MVAATPPPAPSGYAPQASPAAPPYGAPYPYYAAPPPRMATAGRILSGTFRVWADNFLTFFGVYLLLAIVTGAIGVGLSFAVFRTVGTGGVSPIPGLSTVSTTDIVVLVGYVIVAILADVIVTTVVLGGMTELAVRRFRGETIPVEHALRRGLQKFLSLFGAAILVALILIGIVLVPFLLIIPVAVTGGALPAMLALLCGLGVAALFAIYVGVALDLYAPAIMLENATAVGGLSRSWRITKGHWWSLFGALLLILILGAIVTGIIDAIAGATGNGYVGLAGSVLASAIVSPWVVIAAAVAYDLIVRQTWGPAPPPYPYGPQPVYAPPAAPPPSPPGSSPPPGP